MPIRLEKTRVSFSEGSHDIDYVLFHEPCEGVDSKVQEWLNTTKDKSNQSLCKFLKDKLGIKVLTRAEAKYLNIKRVNE